MDGANDAADEDRQRQVHAVMQAAHALVGIVIASLGEAENVVSVAQVRILLIVGTHGPLAVNALASAVGVHPSNATRACDPLVAKGLLNREASTSDRRQVRLTLTDSGREVVGSVLRYRRAAVSQVLARMPADRREGLAPALESFAAAAGDIVDDGLWPVEPTPAT